MSAAGEAGITCASAALSDEVDIRDDIECAANIYKGVSKISDGTCNTCLDELEDDINKYLENHGGASETSFPSPTGAYGSSYETQYAQKTGVFSYGGSGSQSGSGSGEFYDDV